MRTVFLIFAGTLLFLPGVDASAQAPAAKADVITITIETFQEKGGYVPAQIVLAGPTHHTLDVLGNNSLSSVQVQLKEKAVYLLKVRYGTRGHHTFAKVSELTVPPKVSGAQTTLRLRPNAVGISQTQTTSDMDMKKVGKGFAVSIDSTTTNLYSMSHNLSASSADEYGYQRQWQNKDGKTLFATYVTTDGSQITLKGLNGRLFVFDLALLSDADRGYVATFGAKR